MHVIYGLPSVLNIANVINNTSNKGQTQELTKFWDLGHKEYRYSALVGYNCAAEDFESN